MINSVAISGCTMSVTLPEKGTYQTSPLTSNNIVSFVIPTGEKEKFLYDRNIYCPPASSLTFNKINKLHGDYPKLPSDLQEEIKSEYKHYLKRTIPKKGFIVPKALEVSTKWGCSDLVSVINILYALHQSGCTDFDDLVPEDIWLHRATSAKYLDFKSHKIGNVVCAIAGIEDNEVNGLRTVGSKKKIDYDFVDLGYVNRKHSHDRRFSLDINRRDRLPHGGINLFVSTDKLINNSYQWGDRINIRINLADALDKNAAVYTDLGVQGAIILALPIGDEVLFHKAQQSSLIEKLKRIFLK